MFKGASVHVKHRAKPFNRVARSKELAYRELFREPDIKLSVAFLVCFFQSHVTNALLGLSNFDRRLDD